MVQADKTDGAAETLKVLTYNIQSGHDLSGALALGGALEVLKRADADLGGLNEVDCFCQRSEYSDLTSEVRKQLNLSAVFAPAIPLSNGEGNASGNYGVSAFAKQPLRVMEQFALPVPEDSEGRTAVIVKVGEIQPLYLVVTHLPWEKGELWDRVLIDCLKKIEARVAEGRYFPAILVGDMNQDEDTPLLQVMRENWTVCNDVNPQPTWPADKPRRQIDYIAFQPKDAFEVVSCETLDERVASDHRPLMAVLKRRK